MRTSRFLLGLRLVKLATPGTRPFLAPECTTLPGQGHSGPGANHKPKDPPFAAA